MRRAILVRHAKSSWGDMSLRDHDRPLNGRGKRDGPRMAAHLYDSIDSIDAIITSSAVRAKLTSQYFKAAFEDSIDEYIIESDLYHASESTILEVIQRISDKHHTVLIFGHNPGYTDFANQYHSGTIDNVPTCGIVGISYKIDDWADASDQNGEVSFFYYPKML